MSLFRLYIDEVGNHDMSHTENPNERFLSLTGIIIESDFYANHMVPGMDKLKRDFFTSDPDYPVIFHRKEMVNKRNPFETLRDTQTQQNFNLALLNALAVWEYFVVTVVIDKLAHKQQYRVWVYHPYHYCLKVLLERYLLFLVAQDSKGDVIVESRGRKENSQLMESYQRLYYNGTENIYASQWQNRMTSKDLKIKLKSSNICGLQLADLIAHPSRREILLEHKLIEDQRKVFGDQICSILNADKYLRNLYSGKIKGYGKKLLP